MDFVRYIVGLFAVKIGCYKGSNQCGVVIGYEIVDLSNFRNIEAKQ